MQELAALDHPAYSTPADLTLCVSGLPEGLTDPSPLEELCGEFGTVTHATVALPVREVLLRMDERRALVETVQTARIQLFVQGRRPRPTSTYSRRNSNAWDRRAMLRSRVERAQQRLADHDSASHDLARQVREAKAGTGVAFVTFASAEQAKDALAAINRREEAQEAQEVQGGALCGCHLSACRAPEPADVIWENLQVSGAERSRRSLVALGVTLAIACFGTAIIASICYVNGEQLLMVMLSLPDGLGGIVLGFLFNLAMTLPVVVGYVSLFITVPILASKYERYTTFAEKERHVMLRLTFFQVFNLVVAAAAFLIDPDVRADARKWYSLGGALIANFMFGDFILIQVLLDWVRVDTVINRNCIAPRAATQLQMDRLYTADAGLYLAYRLQLAGKFVIICGMFGSAIPLLYLIAAGYFWLAGWVDRYNLLRRLAPPPVTGTELVASVALGVVPIAVCLHVGMALVFFSFPPTSDHDEGGDQAAVRAAAAAVAAAALSTAGAELNLSSLSNLTKLTALHRSPAAPLSPPPPPSPPPHTGESISAFQIQVVTTCFAAVCIAIFYVREWARRHGVVLRLLSDAQQRAVLQASTLQPPAASMLARPDHAQITPLSVGSRQVPPYPAGHHTGARHERLDSAWVPRAKRVALQPGGV